MCGVNPTCNILNPHNLIPVDMTFCSAGRRAWVNSSIKYCSVCSNQRRALQSWTSTNI